MKKKLASRRAFTPTNNYIQVKDIASNSKYEMSLDQARELIAERDRNGLVKCGMQIGRRFFIDEDKFNQWISLNFK